MDIATTLNEITALSVEDRIVLVQAIWDSIAAEQGTSQLGDEYNYSDQVYDCNPIKPSVPHSGTHTYALTPLAHSP
ncbi:addiction module protein, partial [Spirulina sp. CCNP1310]